MFSYIAGTGSFEIFFPKRHVENYPNREINWNKEVTQFPLFQEVPYFNPNFGIPLPVTNLLHVTHFDNASAISQGDGYTFKAFSKTGRSNDTTYRLCDDEHLPPTNETTYLIVPDSEEILPGKYLWWSVEGPTFERKPYMWETGAYGDKDGYGYQPSELIQQASSPYSRYGTVAFRADFQKLLQAYEDMFSGTDVKVIFKEGGTLRYMKEICKVIIVCAKVDGVDPLEGYPSMAIDLCFKCGITGGYHYRNNNLVRDDGFNCSWDHYTFAFHFPAVDDQLQEMKLDRRDVTQILVEHNWHSAGGKRREEPSRRKCIQGDWCPDRYHGDLQLEQ